MKCLLAGAALAGVALAAALPVRAQMPPEHEHVWTAYQGVAGNVSAGKRYALCNQVITVDVMGGGEWDECTVWWPPCTFWEWNNLAFNNLTLVQWNGARGGQYGHLDGTGQFVPGDPVTHYKCPNTTGDVLLSATLDDDPWAWDPVIEDLVPTFDDPAAETGAAQVTVWRITNPLAPNKMRLAFNEATTAPETDQQTLQASILVDWSLMPETPMENSQWALNPDPAGTAQLTVQVRRLADFLPAANSEFGWRGAQARPSADPQADMDAATIGLFFPKLGQNHPLGTDRAVDLNGLGASPNWYFYWSQTWASPTYGDGRYHLYDSSQQRSRTEFMNTHWQALMGPLAAEGPLCPGWGYPSGIDLFAWVVRHEAQHVLDYTADWGNADRVPNLDADGDWLRDLTEPQKVTEYHPLGYLPVLATYPDDEFGYGAGWSDGEDWALHRQDQWVNGLANGEDWSTGGKQWN